MNRFFFDNRSQLAVAASFSLVAVLAYALFGAPRQSSNARKAQQLRELDANIERSSLAVNDMMVLLQNDSLLGRMHDQPEERILPDLLESISEQGRRYGVEIISMKPSAITRAPLTGSIPPNIHAESTRLVVAVSVRARYRNLGEYLKSLEDLPILVAVRDVRIQHVSGSQLLDVSFNIETYSVRAKDA